MCNFVFLRLPEVLAATCAGTDMQNRAVSFASTLTCLKRFCRMARAYEKVLQKWSALVSTSQRTAKLCCWKWNVVTFAGPCRLFWFAWYVVLYGVCAYWLCRGIRGIHKWRATLLDATDARTTWLPEQGKGCLTWSTQSQTGPDLLDSDLILALCVCRAAIIFQRATHAQAGHCWSWPWWLKRQYLSNLIRSPLSE